MTNTIEVREWTRDGDYIDHERFTSQCEADAYIASMPEAKQWAMHSVSLFNHRAFEPR